MCIPWAEVFPFFLTGYGPRFRRPLSASVLVSQASWLAQGTARRAEVRGATAVGTKRGTFTGYGTFTGTAESAEVQGAGPSQGQQTQGLGRVRKDFVLVNTLARGKDLARTPDKPGQTSGHDSVSLAEPWASTSGQASLTSERRHSLATKRAGPSAWGFPEKADFRRGASPFVRRRVTPLFCIGLCTKGRTYTLQLPKKRNNYFYSYRADRVSASMVVHETVQNGGVTLRLTKGDAPILKCEFVWESPHGRPGTLHCEGASHVTGELC